MADKSNERRPPARIAKLMAEMLADSSFWGVVARQAADKFMPEKSPASRAAALLTGAALLAQGEVSREDFMGVAAFVFDAVKKGG